MQLTPPTLHREVGLPFCKRHTASAPRLACGLAHVLAKLLE